MLRVSPLRRWLTVAALVCATLLLCAPCSAASSPAAAASASDRTMIRALELFVRKVLDRDEDGSVDRHEFQLHLAAMDDDLASLPASLLSSEHGQHDLDGDGAWDARELCLSLSLCSADDVRPGVWERLLGEDALEPTQIHLAASVSHSRVLVSWAQNVTGVWAGVQWGYQQGGPYPFVSEAFLQQRYTHEADGLSYTSLPLYTANMTGLVASTRVFYRVGTEGVQWSDERAFTSLPDSQVPAGKQLPTRMVTYGDQGTILPYGATVCKWVEEEHAANPFGAMLHVGDLSYAAVNSKGEWQPTWDVWMQQISPLASSMPYMVTVGNHEAFYDYVSYRHRFHMPGEESKGNQSWWWSFDQGGVHVTSFSTEADYTPGSVQYAWIEEDFRKARSNPTTPWLVFAGHRPMYGSDKQQFEAHIPGCPLLQALEPLIAKYRVDLVLSGHCHSYERSYPVHNGTYFPQSLPQACPDERDHELQPHAQGELDQANRNFWAQVDDDLPLPVYDRDNPESAHAPVYVVQGTAGILQYHGFVDPQPEWSANRILGTYGYGVLSVSTTRSGCSTLLYQFRTEGQKVVDQIAMVKRAQTQLQGGGQGKQKILLTEQ